MCPKDACKGEKTTEQKEQAEKEAACNLEEIKVTDASNIKVKTESHLENFCGSYFKGFFVKVYNCIIPEVT